MFSQIRLDGLEPAFLGCVVPKLYPLDLESEDMGKRRSFGSIEKRGNRYRAFYLGPDGKRHYAPHTFTVKTHAEAWLAHEDQLISLDAWTPPKQRAAKAKARELPLSQWVETVIQERLNRPYKPLAPTTADLYRKSYRTRLAALGGLNLGAVTADVVADWFTGLPDTPTANWQAYSLLKSVMEDAVNGGLIEKNPCTLQARKPEPKHEGKALTVPELLNYLEAVDPHYRLALAVCGLCGLRSGEVRALQRQDVDIKAAMLNIVRNVTRVSDGPGKRIWRVGPPKTQAGIRSVAVPTFLIEPLKRHLDGMKDKRPNAWLFPSTTGTPLDEGVLRRAHNKAKLVVGKPSLVVHDLRRTTATLAAQQGATIKELMRLLGHTTARVAMIYQTAEDERDRQRAQRLNEAISIARQQP